MQSADSFQFSAATWRLTRPRQRGGFQIGEIGSAIVKQGPRCQRIMRGPTMSGRRDPTSSVPPPSWPGAPPTTGPPAAPYRTYYPGPGQRTFADSARNNAKAGSNLLVAGAALHALSIPVGLLLFKVIVEGTARRSVSWGEIFAALEQTGLLALIVGGILAQVIFASIAVVGAVLLRAGRQQAAIPMIVLGVVAVIFSFAIFGGIVGAIGGFLTIAGGAKGRPKPPPPWASAPQPYYGPPKPPYRP